MKAAQKKRKLLHEIDEGPSKRTRSNMKDIHENIILSSFDSNIPQAVKKDMVGYVLSEIENQIPSSNYQVFNDKKILECEYVSEIHQLCLTHEVVYDIKWQRIPHITPQNRSILIDWLEEVAFEYNLNTETLLLSIQYIDKYLSSRGETVTKTIFQLLGITCLFLAAKYEEIYPPNISDFVYITDDTYTISQILDLEVSLLSVLDYRLNCTTADSFLRQLLYSLELDSEIHCHAYFLLELLIPLAIFMKYKPSIIASAVTYVSLHNYHMTDKLVLIDLVRFVGDKDALLKECILKLWKVHVRSFQHGHDLQACINKYGNNEFFCVAKKPPNKKQILL